ncbi:MAG: DegV family protein [Actinomycetales bacterium]
MPQRAGSPLDWLRERLPRIRAGAVSASWPASVAVITDSASALPAEWIGTLPPDGRLAVLPMPIMVDGEIFGEGADDVGPALALALAAAHPVHTSRPSPGQFDRVLAAADDAGYRAAVVVVLSAKLSGTYESAVLAAERSPLPTIVVDSGTAGMAQGFAVQAAYAVAAAGGSAEETAAAARAVAGGTELYFYVPSLDQLRRGGRIGLAAAWLGTVFAIKPILALRQGAVVPLERVRTAARAIARLEEIVAADVASRAPGTIAVAVHHFGNEPQARELAQRLRAASPRLGPVTLSPLPAVLGAHAGLGVLGVIVCGPPAAGPSDGPPGASAPPQPGSGAASST